MLWTDVKTSTGADYLMVGRNKNITHLILKFMLANPLINAIKLTARAIIMKKIGGSLCL
jgi:hypothetical protein